MLYFKRLHIARLLLRAVLQRVRFAPRPSRPLTRAAATELQYYYSLISPLAHPVQDSRRGSFFSLLSGVRRKFHIFCCRRRGPARASTYKRGIVANGCSIVVAVGKDQARTLPRMGATDANVVRIAAGDLPPCAKCYNFTEG